jgi:hypothetical protein
MDGYCFLKVSEADALLGGNGTSITTTNLLRL